MFEIFILYILVNGLVIYIKGYNVPLAEKATLNNVYSTAGAFKTAFHHLYTWLIIINVLLIILIFVFMKIRYDAIKNLAPGQPFNDTGESMYKRLVNVGSSVKNSVLATYNQAGSLKNTLSQNTILGKARMPFSGKDGAIKNAATSSGAGKLSALMGSGAGAGMPGMGAGMPGMGAGMPGMGAGIGGIINAAGSLDSKTLGSLTSSAVSAASAAAKDPNLRKAALSAASGKGLDIDAISKADPKNLQKVLDSGVNAVGALEKDPASVNAAAGLLGANSQAVGKLASATGPALTALAGEAAKNPATQLAIASPK